MNLHNRLVILLLILQADVTGFLVALNFENDVNQNTFALFLTIDLIAFVMMSYIYRAQKSNDNPKRGWIVVGSCVIVGVFFSSLFFR